jgi:predicted DNA-binding protein
MKTYNRTPIWMYEPQLGENVNVEPLLELLSKNTAEEYAEYVDEAIKWLIESGLDNGTDFMKEVYNLYAIRDMFLEMATSSLSLKNAGHEQ